MINEKEKSILRELAKQYMECALSDENTERLKRAMDINDLKVTRPIVLIDEVPWHQLNIDNQLTLVCEDEFARNMEWEFRKKLFQWKYFKADMLITPYWGVHKAYTSTRIADNVIENTISADEGNNIISHHYIDQLETEDDLEKIHKATVTVYPQKDAENIEMAQDILGDIMPVRLKGNYVYYAPWDEIARLKPLNNILIDIMDRPDFVHRIIKKHVDCKTDELEQMENLGLFDHDISVLHCTCPNTSDLPQRDFDGEHVRMKDTWLRTMAQCFATVSPAMHDEFDLQYTRPLMDRFGLVYYGCCEPLDNIIPYLKKVPNMRKIGVSPWADVEVCAEQIRGDYVAAFKPNPAFVASDIDCSVVEQEVEKAVKTFIKYGCPYEITLKDISTVSYKVENLQKWNDTVMKVLDKYYK